jgi:nucleoside 2-deoxyribosyltransferase
MIMPQGSDPTFPKKRAVIQDVAERRHLMVEFPMDWREGGAEHSSFDLTRALAGLSSVDCVIADLSLERPSCYYELGLAQALRKRVFLMAEEGTAIHQAASRSETRFYKGLNEYRDIVDGIARTMGEPSAAASTANSCSAGSSP